MWLDATMSFNGESFTIGSSGPIGTMSFGDGRMAMTLAMGDLLMSTMEQALDSAGTPDGLDLERLRELSEGWTMEMVVDGTTMYQRQSYLAELMSLTGRGTSLSPGSLEEALTSGGWILIDTSALGVDAGALAAQQANGAMALDQFADLVSSGDLAIDYVGTDEVRGAPVEVFAMDTTLGELAAVGGGMNMNQFAAPGADVEALLDSPLGIMVWLDGAGRPVRVTMQGSFSVPNPIGAMEMTFEQTIEYFDFDDPSITIDVPTEAVDVTEQFAALIPSSLMTA